MYQVRKKYILTILFFLALLIFFSTLIIQIMDPFDISFIRLKYSFNLYKPERENRDKLIKQYDLLFLQPKTVIIGTSRIKQSIDPRRFEGTKYAPVYNYGVNAAGISEEYNVLKNVIKIDKKLKYVFVELFVMNLLGFDRKKFPNDKGFSFWKKFVEDYFILNFSLASLKSSIATFQINQERNTKKKLKIIEDSNNGYIPKLYTPLKYFSVLNAPSHFAHWPFPQNMKETIYANYIYKISQLCKKNGIKLYFIITPLRSEYLFGLDYCKSWEAVNHVKRLAAENAKTYDFAFLNTFTDEPISKDIKYWPELFHYSNQYGNAIIDEILKAEENNNYLSEICAVLTKENVEDILDFQKKKLSAWDGGSFFSLNLERARKNKAQPIVLGNLTKDSLEIREGEKATSLKIQIPSAQNPFGFYGISLANSIFTSNFYIKDPNLCLATKELLLSFDDKVFYKILPSLGHIDLLHLKTPCGFYSQLKVPTEITNLSSLKMFLRLEDNSIIRVPWPVSRQ